MKIFSAGFLILFGMFSSAEVSRSQSMSSNATLSGTLTDRSGAVISGAQIAAALKTADDGPSSGPIRAYTAKDGHFSISFAPGRYLIRITHPSFISREENIDFAANQNLVVEFTLQIERLASTVIVTAQAEPLALEASVAPVTVLTRTEIEQRQFVSLPELLSTQPGIVLGRTGREGGLASIFMDGGNSNFTKLLIDGAPVTEGGRGINFSNFTVDNIDKIEIVHGAESALYGSDAVSGVIQVFTHRGTTRIPEVTLLGEGGSFSSGRGAAQLSGLVHHLDYSAAGSYFQTDGQGPNDYFLNRTISGNFGWSFTPSNQVRLTLRNSASDAGIAGPTLLRPPSLRQFDDLQNLAGTLTWEFRTGAHWQHFLRGAESRILDYNANPPFFASRDQFNRAGAQAQSSYLFRQGAFSTGYEYEVENAFPSLLGGQHVRRNNQAGYVDGRLQPLSRLTLSAGARAQSNTSFGTRVVPRAGVSYLLRYGREFWGATRARLSYGQGIKEPEMEQAFGTDPCFPGNPALRAVQSRTVSAGVEQLLGTDRARISASYFENRFRDIISFAFDPTFTNACPFGKGTSFNTDLSRARGLNLSGESRPAHWLMIGGNYSYDNTRVLKAPNAFDPVQQPGNRLLRRPVHSGNINLNVAFRRMNWNFAGYFSGIRTDSDFLGLGLTHNPGYARFDVAASYAAGRGFTLLGRVANLFDKQYQEALGFPALGRDIRVGLKYTFHRE